MLCGVDSLVTSPAVLKWPEQEMLRLQDQPGRAELLPSPTCSPQPESPSPLLGHWRGAGLWRGCHMKMMPTTLVPES